jgi:N-acetylglucosaminyldiphosphoundecaprenol N-acetyl-beta-D-mannosaminyltransferase
MSVSAGFQQILGIRFIVGGAHDAINEISRTGGLVAVPAAPALTRLARDMQYLEALLGADFALADSALMVAFWNFIESDDIPKVSGLPLRPDLGSASRPRD